MGDIKKKRRKYNRPRQLFDQARIDEENALVMKYGLKNKREIWKARSAVSQIRRRAKALIQKSDDVKNKFFEQLRKKGFGVNNISDVLALNVENWLDRRLQTLVFKQKLATTAKGARQLIVHRCVLVDGNVVNIPSCFVMADVEKKITLKETKIKTKKIKKEESVEGEE